MSGTSIKAILFDVDGTLVDSESQTDAAIAAVLAHHGHPNVHLPPAETRGRTWGDIASTLRERYTLPALSAADLEAALATEWAASIDAMVPIQGAPEAIRAAAALFRVAVVSSSPRALVDKVLAHLGVAGSVKVRVGGDDVVKPKPDPEGFLRAAELLGARPEECVVFEDSGAGLEAARKAGMPSVLVLVRCDEPERCRPLATGALLHYEAMPPSFWSILHTEGPRALLDLA